MWVSSAWSAVAMDGSGETAEGSTAAGEEMVAPPACPAVKEEIDITSPATAAAAAVNVAVLPSSAAA